jgi:hypothetical protein
MKETVLQGDIGMTGNLEGPPEEPMTDPQRLLLQPLLRFKPTRLKFER